MLHLKISHVEEVIRLADEASDTHLSDDKQSIREYIGALCQPEQEELLALA